MMFIQVMIVGMPMAFIPGSGIGSGFAGGIGFRFLALFVVLTAAGKGCQGEAEEQAETQEILEAMYFFHG